MLDLEPERPHAVFVRLDQDRAAFLALLNDAGGKKKNKHDASRNIFPLR